MNYFSLLFFVTAFPSLMLACNNQLFSDYGDNNIYETAVFAWGRNQFGGLGNGQFEAFALPQKLIYNIPVGKIVYYYSTPIFTLLVNTQYEMFVSGIHNFNPSSSLQVSDVFQKVDPDVSLIRSVSSMITRVTVVHVDGTVGILSGTTSEKLTKVGNFSNENILECSMGLGFFIFLPEHGKGLFAYGTNNKGELAGLLKTNSTVISTVQYADLNYLLEPGEKIISIKSGSLHSIFLTSHTRLFGFGNNEFFQLGLGNASAAVYDVVPLRIPEKEKGLPVISIGATSFGCILHFKSNQIYSAGTGERGELGAAISENGPLRDFTSISDASILSSYEISTVKVFLTTATAISKDGVMISWGYNIYGLILSDSTRARIYSPERANTDFFVKDVSSSEYAYIALTLDGSLYSWGSNLPNSPSSFFGSDLVDLKHLKGNNPIALIDTFASTYGIIDSTNTLYLWGYNGGYQLGQRGNIIIPIPTPYTPRNSTISQATCATTGEEYMMYISKSDSLVYGVGSNYAYQLGDGTKFIRLQPIPILLRNDSTESSHTLVHNSNFNCQITILQGKLYCWGDSQLSRPYLIPLSESLYPIRTAFVYAGIGMVIVTEVNHTLWYINETLSTAIPITTPTANLQVKQLHCSLHNCIFIAHNNQVYQMGQPYRTAFDNALVLEAKHIPFFDSYKNDLVGVKTSELFTFAYTSNRVFGWGVNFNKIIRKEDGEFELYTTPVEVSFVNEIILQGYNILDLSLTQQTAHALVVKEKSIDLRALFALIPITILLLLGFFFIVATIVTISIIIAVKRRRKDIYKQLLDLENKTDNEMPLLLPSKFDCFKINFEQIELLQEIGTGGSGALVFKAKWYNEIVAIKLFRASGGMSNSFDFTLFEQEVELLTQLRHSNIVLFYGATLAKNRVGLVLQYCSNGNLTQFMKKKHLNLKRKIQLLIQLGKALSFLHSKNIIHRDVKMDNILIDENEFVKLSDFGLSKSISENSNMTKGVGTDHMIAPEVTLGQEYDISADVFSFGIIMMELLIEKVNPYIEGEKQVSGIGVKVALDPTCRPRVPLDFPLQTYHKGYLLLMQECWKHEKNERPLIQQVVERLEQIEKELPDTAA